MFSLHAVSVSDICMSVQLELKVEGFLIGLLQLYFGMLCIPLYYRNCFIQFPCDTWVPVPRHGTSSGWLEEWPPTWRVAANILNKQSLTADKKRSSSWGVGRGANNSSSLKHILLRNNHRQSL
jgi:hypothetical protein